MNIFNLFSLEVLEIKSAAFKALALTLLLAGCSPSLPGEAREHLVGTLERSWSIGPRGGGGSVVYDVEVTRATRQTLTDEQQANGISELWCVDVTHLARRSFRACFRSYVDLHLHK